MRPETKALNDLLEQNPVGSFFAKVLFSKITLDLEREMAAMLEHQLSKLENFGEINKALGGSKEYTTKIENWIRYSPFSFLNFGHKLFEAEPTRRFARYLLIAQTTMVMNILLEEQKHFRFLLSHLDPSKPQEDLRTELHSAQEKNSFGRHTYLSAKGFSKLLMHLERFEGLNEKIEMLYLLRCLEAICYRFYFNLMVTSQSAGVTKLIGEMFQPLFLALRKYEIEEFYKTNPNLQKIEYIIEKDAQGQRHPLLRKFHFAQVYNYNPFFHVGTNVGTNIAGQRILQKQQEQFNRMDLSSQLDFLSLMKKFKGKPLLSALLVSIQRTGKDRILKLKEVLESRSSPEDQEMLEVVEQVSKKLEERIKIGASAKSRVQMSYESLRRAEAEANILANQDREMMNHTQVAQYLEDRLKKLYERVKIEGALTQNGIPEYLARLAQRSDSMISGATPSTDDLRSFEEVAADLMKDLCGDMSPDLVARHQEELRQQTEGLRNATSAEQRAEIISDIGINLMEAEKEILSKKGPAGLEELFQKSMIPMGLERNAPTVAPSDFFYFPLAKGDEPDQADWFKSHLQYLDLLRERELIKGEAHDILFKGIEKMPKLRFKKYFDIFPQGVYEDTVLMAVFSLWQNHALEKLRDLS